MNSSPYRPVKWLKEVGSKLHRMDVNLYPDTSYSSLRETLSEYTGFDVDRFVVTNGADEGLDIIAKTFLDAGDEAIISYPTYSYFRIVTEIMGGRAVFVDRVDGFRDNADGILERVGERTRLIFLCSPNNPTGNTAEVEDVRRILEEAGEDVAVVVDEAYYEFCGKTFADLTNNYENLIIVRTFSKAFSLAGARVGYLIAAEETVDKLNKVRPPNSLSIISLALAEIALRDRRTLNNIVRRIVGERERLYRELSGIDGITPYPSEANFVLTRIERGDAGELHQKLMSMGLVLRDLTGVRRLENHLRITVNKPEQNDKLLTAIRKLLGE